MSKTNNTQEQEERYNIKQNIKDSKIMSSGLLAKNGVFALDNPSFVKGFYRCVKLIKQGTVDKAKKNENF